MDQVFITLDKMDKIGLDGVKNELLELGYAAESVEKYTDLLASVTTDAAGVRALGEVLADTMPKSVAENLAGIMDTVTGVAETDFKLEFDPTLVRGMSYYTGTIFEVSMEGFGGSVAGGGRYDKMIGKFTGQDTPACGFSIGFERIITILMDQGGVATTAAPKKAYLIEKNMDSVRLGEIMKQAMADRKAGCQVLVSVMNKNKKFQKEQLTKEGYTDFVEFYREALK
jgi:histidyl-tRNA synthetase